MFARQLSKIAALTVAALLIWSVAARPSGAHGGRTVYVVQPGDSLWSIATRHYAGDPAASVWAIKSANDLGASGISPGERLLLP